MRPLENCLYIKVDKCEFHTSSVTFLGDIFQDGQVKTDPDKIKAVAEWPTPTNRKQLQRFHGFANFYRHVICNYFIVASPLTKLISLKTTWYWTPEAARAFQQLKARFPTTSILIQPNPVQQFILEVDASDSGVGPDDPRINCIPVHFSQLNKIMMWAIGNS